MRNTQRAVILKLIGKAAGAGATLSTKPTATYNAFVALRDDPEFPDRLDRRGFFQILRDMENEGLVASETYTRSNRTPGQRIVLTNAGAARVAIGSGAPPTWAQRDDDDE